MGFFSALLGTGSEWDGANYVAKIAGTKFWSKNFIDKDKVRQAGIAYSFYFYPLDTSAFPRQSPMTIPGELIYLLEVCDRQGDTVGAKLVARAMLDLLQIYSDKIHESTDLRFMLTNYQEYLDENKSRSPKKNA